jgi:magnesium chelatase subunit D
MNRALADALLAVRLLAHDPAGLGGICLRGDGLARDRVVEALRAALPAGTPVWRLPSHIDDDRLSGGIDMAASLAAGTPVREAGLLERARGGVLVVPMAERLRADVAGRVGQAIDAGGGFVLVLLDDGAGPDERASAALLERVAFDLPLAGVTAQDLTAAEPAAEGERAPDEDHDTDDSAAGGDLPELLIEAARAAIPADVLAALASGRAARRSQGGGAGRQGSSARRRRTRWRRRAALPPPGWTPW